MTRRVRGLAPGCRNRREKLRGSPMPVVRRRTGAARDVNLGTLDPFLGVGYDYHSGSGFSGCQPLEQTR